MDQVVSIAIAACLVMLSGLFSGLNLGLMSFTDDDLRVVIEGSTDPNEVKNAKRIRPLRKRGNLLLCTLLLGNTLVNAMIAILLADMASGLVGGLVTTGLIVVFGEITPQSICSRHGLKIGALSVPIVWMFMFICLPIAYPIALLLDYLLGREIGGMYTKSELLALISMNTSDTERAKESGMTLEDAKLLRGALTYRDKTVDTIMTPISDMFALSLDVSLDKETFHAILQKGHTRVPIYEGRPENIVAILHTKDLLGIGYERGVSVREVRNTFQAEERVLRVSPSAKVGEAFELCKKHRRHMLVITDGLAPPLPDQTSPADGALVLLAQGIVTMEDIIEQIIQEEIIDEFDETTGGFGGLGRRLNSQRFDMQALLRKVSDQDDKSPAPPAAAVPKLPSSAADTKDGEV